LLLACPLFFFVQRINMAVQHVDIPDAEIHEPKGIVSAVNRSIYVADGIGSGDWRKLTEADVDYSVYTDNKFGWHHRKDTQYVSGAPLAIASGVKTALPNNGLHPLTNVTRPLGIVYTSTYFTPSSLNASYIIRINAKITAAAVAGTPYVIKVTMEGGAVPLAFDTQDMFLKGGGYVNDMCLTFMFYTGALNTNQPVRIQFTPDTNVSVYDIGYMIQRTYYEG